MPRPLRIEYEGTFYDVTSRGNEEGKRSFVVQMIKDVLGTTSTRPKTNLIIETLKDNLHEIIHYLNGLHTTRIRVSPGFLKDLMREWSKA